MAGSALALALGDALYAELMADQELPTLGRDAGATVAVLAGIPDATRTGTPYVVVGRRELHGDGFAMQVPGGEGDVIIDVWSGFNGPEEVQDIQGRIRRVLRLDPNGRIAQRLAASRVTMFAGSLVCVEELAFQDWDPLMPSISLYHGVQRWHADLEEAA